MEIRERLVKAFILCTSERWIDGINSENQSGQSSRAIRTNSVPKRQPTQLVLGNDKTHIVI